MIAMSTLSSWLLVGALIWAVIILVVYSLLVAAKHADERADAIYNSMRSHPSTGPHQVTLDERYVLLSDIMSEPVEMPPAPHPLYDHEENGDFDE